MLAVNMNRFYLPLTLILGAFSGVLGSYTNGQSSYSTYILGKLYVINPQTKEALHRLDRLDLDAVSNATFLSVRLHLGPDHPALDMRLIRKSVWTERSRLVERKADQVAVILNSFRPSCFLSGIMTSHTGSSSLHICGKLSGIVDTGNYQYSFEESDDNLGEEISPLRVTISNHDNMLPHFDISHVPQDFTSQENDTRSKRQIRTVRIEAAAYLDANFAHWQSTHRNRKTTRELQRWIINKWNLMQQIFGDQETVGIPIVLELKKVEVWWTNPSFYRPVPSDSTENVLDKFCRGAEDDINVDTRMLYTQGTGGSAMGIANLGKVCTPTQKCSLAKSKDEDIFIEMHELGHNLGLPHDDQFDEPCTDSTGAGGFMGWGYKSIFLDCYRNPLARAVNKSSARCLHETNVELPALY